MDSEYTSKGLPRVDEPLGGVSEARVPSVRGETALASRRDAAEHDQLRWVCADDVEHLALPDSALRGFLLEVLAGGRAAVRVRTAPVSYTHLTLPTIYSV